MSEPTLIHPLLQRDAELMRGSSAAPATGMVWLVVRGQIELFLLARRPDAANAAREHWLSLGGGQIFVFPQTDAGEAAMVAAPGPDAEYWVLPRSVMAAGWDSPDGRAVWQPLLDHWIAGMSQRAQAAPPASDFAQWSGAQLLQQCDDLLQQGMQFELKQRQQNEMDELSRLQRKSEIGRQAMADALGGLASLFDKQDAGIHVNGDAVLGACQAIGRVMGITFKAPPPALDNGRRRDPVKDIAQASHIRTRVVALKGAWWQQDNGPLLVFTEEGQAPLALLPRQGGGYHKYDPATGKTTALSADSADALARFGYMFYRSLPSKSLAMADIVRFALGGMRQELVAIALIGIASALLGMAIPVASGHLFDNVFPAADQTQMVQVVWILFVASIVNLLFEATRALVMLRVEGRASNDLQAAVWDRVLNLPVNFFRDYAAGDLATRINGINEIRQALSGSVISSILSGLFSVLNVFLMFYYSAKLALMAVFLVLLAIAFNAVIAWLNVRITLEASELNGKVAGRVLEYLNGIAKLRLTGAEARAFANWAAGFGQQKRLTLRAGKLASASNVFGVVFPVLCNTVIFACIAFATFDKDSTHFSTGDFIAFNAGFILFLNAMLTLMRTAMSLINIGPTYQRTRPILQTLPEVDESKLEPGKLSGAIEISHLSFTYAADLPRVLNDVSISIKPGEFIALVGGSGSGKSTLLRLLLGFEKPTQGDIYYDGYNLKEVDVGTLRRQLGVVLQGGRLMTGDIFSNIIGSSALVLDDAWEAARACGLDKDIQAMPMGMHTVVNDGGSTLSGGQRQRLLIARALVNKPAIIFFDEATSALDNQTQAIVSSSMEALQATRVVIAHRLSTIMNADRIYVLDQGRIMQSGTYQELMQQDGLFADLAKRQII